MSIDHPNVAKIVDVYLGKKSKVFLVMELAEGGELFDKYHYTNVFKIM